MKTIFSSFVMLIALLGNAQTNLEQVNTQIKTFARVCASQNWQSLFRENNSRFEKTHKLDSVVNFDGAGTYIGKTEATYDDQLRTTLIHIYDLDSAGINVFLQGIFSFEYESIELPSHIIAEFWNTETKQIEKTAEYDFYYDAMHRVDSVVVHSEDPLSGQFIPLSATKQVYSGNLLIQTRQWYYISFFGTWIPSSYTDYLYDGQDRLIQQETSVVDLFTMEITPSDRTTYTYNAESLQDTITEFYWSGIAWDPAQRFTAEYYGNGTIANEMRQIYTGTEWINNVWNRYEVEKVTDTYPYTSYIWDPIDGTWQKTDSVVNLLNPALPFDQVVVPDEISVLNALGAMDESPFLADGPSVDETQYFFFDTLSQEFFFTGNEVYHYSMIKGSAVTPVLPDFISVTPNPAQDLFNIDLDRDTKASFRVFNTTGTEVDRGELTTGKNQIHAAHWLPGIYYVVIHLGDGKMYVHKQMVE